MPIFCLSNEFLTRPTTTTYYNLFSNITLKYLNMFDAEAIFWRYFVKKDVLKNFLKASGKYLCWRHPLINLQSVGLQLYQSGSFMYTF